MTTKRERHNAFEHELYDHFRRFPSDELAERLRDKSVGSPGAKQTRRILAERGDPDPTSPR
ncbi:MAG TPA: hypothetical protein VD887_07950 [Allosphingosinicella sp.]|nr:hypothetical protein [Allosphingosinicella sp.]